MRPIHNLVTLTAVVSIFSGCVSTHLGQRATPLEEGKFDVRAGLAGHPLLDSSAVPLAVRGGASLAYGVDGKTDVGVGVGVSLFGGTSGAAAGSVPIGVTGRLHAKRQLLESDDARHVISVMPTASVFVSTLPTVMAGANALAPAAEVAALYGYRFGDGHELTLGPRAQCAMLKSRATRELEPLWQLGSSAGVSFRVSDHVRIMPDVGVYAFSLGSARDFQPALIEAAISVSLSP